MRILLTLTFISMFLISCRTVTISESSFKQINRPFYEETKWFWFWGLVPGVKRVHLDSVCKKQKIIQVQTVDSFVDQVIAIITLGILSPRTVKIWCKP